LISIQLMQMKYMIKLTINH